MYSRDKQPSKIFVLVLIILAVLGASCKSEIIPPQRAGILEGAANFRDLGGYLSEDGKSIVWGKIYRSQTLAQLSDSDVIKIKELGVRTVIDFRDDEEVLKDPSRLPEGVNIVHLPIGVGKNDTLQIMQKLMAGTLDSIQCVNFMQIANRRFVTEFAPEYKAFFDILLQPESYPIIFHCTAGKDRTGFAAAMLLSALDVNWDTVMDDYLLTNQYLKPQSIMPQIPEQALPALRQMWGVQPSYLNAAKEEIKEVYGSIDNYLERELNVGNVEKNKLKEYLLK